MQKLIATTLINHEPKHVINGLVKAAQTLGKSDTFQPLYKIFLEVKKLIVTWHWSLQGLKYKSCLKLFYASLLYKNTHSWLLLQTVASSLGDELEDLLNYLSSEVNEALLADVERSQDLLMELLIAALKSETKDSPILFFHVLKNALPEGPDKKRVMVKIAVNLARRAPEHRERFAEAIVLVVSCFFKLLTKEEI